MDNHAELKKLLYDLKNHYRKMQLQEDVLARILKQYPKQADDPFRRSDNSSPRL
jgi:hypothetical protein